jgi:hypothetical protein
VISCDFVVYGFLCPNVVSFDLVTRSGSVKKACPAARASWLNRSIEASVFGATRRAAVQGNLKSPSREGSELIRAGVHLRPCVPLVHAVAKLSSSRPREFRNLWEVIGTLCDKRFRDV